MVEPLTVSPLPESQVFSQPHYLNSPWLTRNYIDWSFLRSYGTPLFVKKNRPFPFAPEPAEKIYYIARGRVRSSVISEDGEEKIILVVDQGNIIDAVSIIDGLPTYLVTTTVADSLLYEVKKKVFLDLIDTDKEISHKLLQDLTRKIRILITHVEDLSFMSSSSRIAKCLYRLSHEYGVPAQGGIKLNIKFTHQEMAIYAGTCRVTSSNILENLEKAGIIKKDNGFVIITDIQKLKQCIDPLK